MRLLPPVPPPRPEPAAEARPRLLEELAVALGLLAAIALAVCA